MKIQLQFNDVLCAFDRKYQGFFLNDKGFDIVEAILLTPQYVEQAMKMPDANKCCGLKEASWLWTTFCTENSWEKRPTSTGACWVELYREYHDFHSQNFNFWMNYGDVT